MFSAQTRQTLAAVFSLWKERHKLAEKRLPVDLKSFLPPSLEVMEKPPHPAPRIILAIIGGICLFALIWAVAGKVDIITVAEGKIIPSGKIKEIQPYDRGVVSRILVEEGQLVEAGAPLIELDRTQTTADEFRLLAEERFAEEKKLRREILIELLRRPDPESLGEAEIKSQPGLKGDLNNGRLLYEEYKSIIAQWQTLESQLRERQAEWASSQEVIKQLSATLPLIEQRLSSYRTLFERKLVTINEYLALEEERLRQFHGLESEKSRSEQLGAAIVSTERQIEARRAQSLSEVLNELEDLRRQGKALAQELAKVRDLSAKQVLYAPVRGTVKGLVANTVGGVVEPAKVLMELVPMGETLEVEAFVGNQDIGYVRAGQSAEIKINTFPFTKYGVIDAVVGNVAEDATVDEKLGLIYRTRLVLAKSSILVSGREVPLLPGMAVSAEIATDQRRLIEFFLAPLLKMKDESLRER
ncbi:MAG: HlyD family type I secretion periplasmic adaptor subunit [Candidatus Adiutrix sp.]|jgi:hemolysin D|nr:HlyD family type I secretion periplasmic adaptor subunit [Candidatus Adiutrix sp.]